MCWVLEGKQVKGKYFGIPFTGVVTESRVKYGGRVSHTVALDSPIKMIWDSGLRNTVIVENDELEA